MTARSRLVATCLASTSIALMLNVCAAAEEEGAHPLVREGSAGHGDHEAKHERNQTEGSAHEGEAESEPAWVVFGGGVAERSIQDATNKTGPSLAVETGILDNELKLEWGLASFHPNAAREWKTNVTVKLPFEIAERQELAVGLGPTWTHSNDPAGPSAAFGAEFVVEYLIWPTRHVGFYVAPSYGYSFDATHTRSAGVAAGLAFAIY
jgi:hypothetical protein